MRICDYVLPGENRVDFDQLLEHPQKMSDAELIEFDETCASLRSPRANFGKPPREVFAIQLAEARAEWRRRHPK
jgi:hypothetical protein